ncbi:DUF72 domain-containing protein [Aquisphaera insulae]|uniref:DUF72 domain-containing protein n=1 Tax=Aquisphaera insulae TaxID=2712864 RepID=UPI0013EC59D0|nr:DUF72 domain-containing protein [Aquisphaera insulae]
MAESKSQRSGTIRVGCAGWSLPKEISVHFPAEGTHLERYAARFPAVEINSSFYRPHRPATYARWSASVTEDFAFSVKVPKLVTHERRLKGVDDVLDGFLSEVTQLGEKLGPLLDQLPPSLSFSAAIAEGFLASLRQRFDGAVALEPRHASWFEPVADQLLTRYRVARVAADPAIVPTAGKVGGWDGLAYFRLHGSPKVYYSTYAEDYLANLAKTLIRQARTAEVWCIFDNTAEGAATANALDVLTRIRAD